MKAKNVAIPADVQMIIVTMGTLAHPSLTKLTAEEIKQDTAKRQAEHERITQLHGDFTGKVRDGVVDNGRQLVSGDPLYTGAIVSDLFDLGFRLVDAYTTDKNVNGALKPNNVAVFSNNPEMPVNARVTAEVIEAIVSVATKNWYKGYIWYNPLWTPVSMTINVSGDLRQGTPQKLVLTSAQPAEANKA